MENEENRGLINKKTSQDQLARFFTGFGGSPFYYSLFLILLDTWSFLGVIHHCAKEKESKKMKDKEIKGNQRSSMEKHDLEAST